MNWKETKEKCPKAFGLITNKFDLDYFVNDYQFDTVYHQPIEHRQEFNFRDLYDFFDENGIYAEVRPYNDYGDKWMFHLFGAFTFDSDLLDMNFKSRTEAETEAFNKAFEILENKLT